MWCCVWCGDRRRNSAGRAGRGWDGRELEGPVRLMYPDTPSPRRPGQRGSGRARTQWQAAAQLSPEVKGDEGGVAPAESESAHARRKQVGRFMYEDGGRPCTREDASRWSSEQAPHAGSRQQSACARASERAWAAGVLQAASLQPLRQRRRRLEEMRQRLARDEQRKGADARGGGGVSGSAAAGVRGGTSARRQGARGYCR